MKNKKRILLIICVLFLTILLTACSKDPNEPTTLEKPIMTGMVNGWFTDLLVKPIAVVMDFIIRICGNLYAIGLLVTTILVRTIAWPIYAKSSDMSVKMQLMQPELTRLEAKYVTRRDPESMQKKQMEMMAIYKKYGVSIFGCLTPFIQMPIFMAMYYATMRYTIPQDVNGFRSKFADTLDVLNTKLFWMDLSKKNYSPFQNGWTPENLQYIILPIVVAGTMVLQYVISSRKPKDVINRPSIKDDQQKQQQRMMMYMQIIMIVMMFIWSFQSAALAFYWCIGNVYSLFQQIIGKKLSQRKLEKLKKENSIIG